MNYKQKLEEQTRQAIIAALINNGYDFEQAHEVLKDYVEAIKPNSKANQNKLRTPPNKVYQSEKW